MSWYRRRGDRSADVRSAQVARKIAQLQKQGHIATPVRVQGRAIATTFWGKAWCSNLETYSDYSNRLPRGRTYVRNGSILDLQIVEGRVEALVSGSRLYEVNIRIDTLSDERWSAIRQACSGQIDSLIDLLQGQLSDGVMAVVTNAAAGLFPAPHEIHFRCSCPDWASMCKHVAAVLYGVGNRLDHAPELLFSLRGVDPATMIVDAIERGLPQRRPTTARVLAVDDLSAVFGVDIDFSDDALRSPSPRAKQARAPKPSRPTHPKAPVSGDLSARARQVLQVITEEPGLRTPELARRLGVSTSTISTAVAQLKAEGLIGFIGAPKTGGYRCME